MPKSTTNNQSLVDFYKNKIAEYETRVKELSNTLTTLSMLRFLVFAFSSILIIFLINERQMMSLFIAVPVCLLGFVFLIKHFNHLSYQKHQAFFLKQVNEHEVLRIENKLSGFPTGQSFISRDHPNVADLDVFGSHSLFQLINRTTTAPGSALMATWLSTPASNTIIRERQEAVKELSSKIDWRQRFQASGMHFSDKKSDIIKMLTWLEEPVQLRKHALKYKIISITLTLLSSLSAVFFTIHLFNAILGIQDFSLLYFSPLAICLFINWLVLKSVSPTAEKIIENTQYNIKILSNYQSLILTIATEKFNAENLRQLQSSLASNGHSASHEINKLKNILELFHLRGRKGESIGGAYFYAVFNMLWLFDIYCIMFIEKWITKNRSHVNDWVSAVSEFEILSSLAGFSYSNPSFCFPDLVDDSFTIHFEMLGHPLISKETRVCNDFNLTGRGEIAMITGSNMAGKSTFLRSVGINLVLAYAGAPCCANSGKVSNLKIFTSMRTQDELGEGISSFYAELRRIQQLLKLITGGHKVFFLLDEMFKGTNSDDRYIGGVSLIKQLSDLNAFGIISTHDLKLAKLTENNMRLKNYSFNSKILEDKIIFDYKITQGICKDFNASELMKRSGINILPNIKQI